MKLVQFSVKNFRSITKAKNLPISNLTVLIGPNNEGKSNILSALVLALDLAANSHNGLYLFQAKRRRYNWERDYPVSLKPSDANGYSEFILEFELDEKEVFDFKAEVKSNLDGTLPIKILIGKDKLEFKVIKKGIGGPALSKKTDKIARFIGKRLDISYIPAVRTASTAIEVVEDILSKELEAIESDEKYRKALEEIKKLQVPLLEKLSERVSSTLKEFLPKVKHVKIEISEEARHRALRRSTEVIVDDGTPTRLQQKGDGIQSLAAISLMRNAFENNAKEKHLILAVEEPESHLHPKAIHQLRKVISDISRDRQLILSTHCPLLVDRHSISSNIIVNDGEASQADSISEIREILGIKTSDNLKSAELVLLVEGEDDRRSLVKVLSDASGKLKEALNSGLLAIDSTLGTGNLSYKLSLIRESICMVHCMMDNDQAGRDAIRKAELEGLVLPADITLVTCIGMKDSEFEDAINKEVYATEILNTYGVDVFSNEFSGKKKWSERMKNLMMKNGKPWDDSKKQEIKNAVAKSVENSSGPILQEQKGTAIVSLISALEKKLNIHNDWQ
jgi:predicted ATP-dependent endonuclease of OLD family